MRHVNSPASRFARGIVAFAAAGTLLVTAGCSAGTPAPATASGYESVPGLPADAIKTMEQPQYSGGHWGIYVQDLETGETLLDLNGDKFAEPGSFTKTYSVGAAWLHWGPDHTVTTPIKQMGTVTDGTLQGDLVMVGKGDLTMDGRTKSDGTVDFTNLDHNDANPLPGATLTDEDPLTGLNVLAEQVKAAGINAVSGDVIIDDRLFNSELAGEPITPIIINQNLLDVMVTPGSEGEFATVSMTPAVAPWQIVSEVTTVATGESASISNPEVSTDDPSKIIISGTIAADSEPTLKVFALDDPSTFARTALIEALQRAGVTVKAQPTGLNPVAALPDQATVNALPNVAELKSLPLAEEATYVMKISYNRGAQTLMCRLAAEAGDPTCDTGMSLLHDIWTDAGLDTTGVSLIDASGLDGNFIEPENAVQVQTILADRADAERWRDTLPILGVDGSLSMVQADSPAAGKVFAKTGTLMGWDALNERYRLTTKSLGGVMEAKSGKYLAFTVMMNHGISDDINGVFAANDDVGAVAAAIQQAF